jgi:uncharacterized membrane protein YqjE
MFDTAKRIGATLLAMLQTRLELAAVELEEEARRFLRYAVLGVLALFLFGVAVVLAAFFIVLLFWEDHRLEAVGVLALLFGGGAAFIALKLKNSFAAKPRFMADTVGELKKDLHTFRRPYE